MVPLITPAAMRAMERRYFDETGTPSIDLMETAARTLCDMLIARYGANRRVGFACGPGGNGGDGYACARMYKAAGGAAFIVSAGEPTSPDAAENLRRAREAGVSEDDETAPEIWVDALYGTGLSRAPTGRAAEFIERISADRDAGTIVVAVDIPSGLNGTTGTAYAPCVHADLTCTFQYVKPGCFLADGLDVAGEVAVLDIGIPKSFYPKDSPALVDGADIRAVLTKRPRNFHKGNAGHLLIVAGSFGMAGAAAMCAQSALATGAGLVTIACPRSIVPILQTLAPCAMCVPLPEESGAISAEAVDILKDTFTDKNAVVCGCGLSRRASPEVVRAVLECGLPALLDADALNLISESIELKKRLNFYHLLTPHPGEAARLLGRRMGNLIDWRRMENPIDDALALQALGSQALLKGATTLIPVENRVLLSASGTSGMAKGGSGDCLSGVIGALMVQNRARLTGEMLALCAAVGSELHGLAGALACERRGIRGMTPIDLIDALPEVLMRYE